MNKKYSMVIAARNIFDGAAELPREGYLCIYGNKIVKTGLGRPAQEVLDQAEQVLRFQEELVMPGIVDTHTFFTGYAIYHIGADVSEVSDSERGCLILKKYGQEKKPEGALFGHGWNPELWDSGEAEKMIENEYPDKPVIIFSADRCTCIMNQKARMLYQFTPDTCYPEKYFRIMREYLNDRTFIKKEFQDYMAMMNARGVTTVKEMGFDDFYGFTDYLKEMEESGDLHLRTFFMSQPVGCRMDLEYAKRMRDLFTGDKIRFSGFNCMTDGTIADYRGDLKQPYEGKDFTCGMEIAYDQIEADVLAADAEGFRYSLHAQGNGAVAKAAEIYGKCRKVNGKLKNRHALTDMEYSDAEDIEELGSMGANAELYFQIMSLDPGEVIRNNIKNTIGEARGKNYWNRRKMADAGMNLSGATDLPLMITNVPESIYYSGYGYLQGEGPFQQENTLSVGELLKAWTIGGQRNLGMEAVLGTLEEGKLADITVFDRNLFQTRPEDCKEAKAVMTIMDGKTVYNERG
ncbi:amidohydrolase family protein [Lachnospiraceae bacterium 54-53]